MRFNEIKNLHENQQVIDKLEDKKFDLQHGLQIDDYQERKVFQAKNQLESEIFELEEVFKEAIKNIDNKIEQLGYEE